MSSESQECLFIGGPFDGKKRRIASGHGAIMLQCSNGEDPPKESRYFRILPFVFAHESLSNQETMQLLADRIFGSQWRLPIDDDNGKYCYIRDHNRDASPYKIECRGDRWFYLDERNKWWQAFHCEIARIDRPE